VDTVVRLRHLPLFDVPVFVEIRPKRYRCPYGAGHPTTTQRCEWYEPRSPNTKAFEPWALRMLINSTVADAARKLGGSEETLDGLLDRWIERTVDWDAWERLGVLGLDEIALTRCHVGDGAARGGRSRDPGSAGRPQEGDGRGLPACDPRAIAAQWSSAPAPICMRAS
jgi:hypothetical protein